MRLTELKKIIREELAAMMPQASHDDHEVEMAITDLKSIASRAAQLVKFMQEKQPHELEGWVQSKITKSADYINAVYDTFMFPGEDDDCHTCGDHMNEAKSTCCGKCGHYHVKGTSCPKPYLTGKRHCRNRPR